MDGFNVQTTHPHGEWRCPYDTAIDIQFNIRGDEVELKFQLLDNSDSYQELQTNEVILMPWNETPERGPTVRSLAQTQLRRMQAVNM